MKFSIIVPTYNESKMIQTCLKSLILLDYPKKDYEIVVINDGSTDDTTTRISEIIQRNEQVQIRVVNQKNLGRALARENGAKSSKYQNLLFIDSRCRAHSDILLQLSKTKFQAVVGNPLLNQETNLGRFGYLFRKKLYGGSFENFAPFEITPKNFDKVGKGTTVLYCKKDIFLKSQLINQASKDNSDDTYLLWNILQKVKIQKNPNVKIDYSPRTKIKKHLIHTFNRGPKFVDYYYNPKRRYFFHINLLLMSIIVFLAILVISPLFFLYLLLLLGVFFLFSSFYLAENSKDFFIVLFYMPITLSFFVVGIIKGVLMKILGRY